MERQLLKTQLKERMRKSLTSYVGHQTSKRSRVEINAQSFSARPFSSLLQLG